MSRSDQCPQREVLSAYGLGRLNSASAKTVEAHVSSCDTCRQFVSSLSGDSFLDRARGAPKREANANIAAPPAKQASNTRQPGPNPTQSLPPGEAATKESVSSAKHPTETISGRAQSLGGLNPRAVSADPNLAIPPELANHPDYELLKELGRGGMGVVYLARNRMMDRLEVLKVVSRALLDDPGSLERFQQEIRSAARLSHPNIVAAHSVLRVGDLLALAMQYVAGEDLSQVVKRRGPLPIVNATFYIQQAALGLQHAHEKGMVHRDIKPNNLMLAIENKKHVVKILDFGLAKATSEKRGDAGLTRTGQMLGTPDYVAPEQTLDAQKADIRADIYSLGCTLYFLLAGRPPFDGNSLFEILRAHHTTEATPLNLVRPDAPVELAAVVSRMMAKDPARRYQTPIEVANALRPFFKAGAAPPQTAEAFVPSPAMPAVSLPQQAAIRLAVEQAPPGAAPADAEAGDPLAGLLALATQTSAEKTRAKRVPKQGGRKPPWLPFAVAGGALVPLLVLAAVFFVRVKTPEGVVVIRVNEPNPEVLVDGNRVTLTWANGGKSAEIRVTPGSRKIEVKKDGFKAFGEEVVVEDGGRTLLSARLEATKAARDISRESDSKGFDLLKMIEPDRDSVKGGWFVKQGVLTASPSQYNDILQIPFHLPRDYSLTIAGEIEQGELFVVGLVVGGKPVSVCIDAYGSAVTGLCLLDGQPANNNETSNWATNLLGSPQKFEVACTVHAASVSVVINGKVVVDWSGEPERLSLPADFSPPRKEDPWLLTHINSIVHFSAIKFATLPPEKKSGDFSRSVPTSEHRRQSWKYTFDQPTDDWNKFDFHDESWKIGLGGFGDEGAPGRTLWKTPDVWLRRDFMLADLKTIPHTLRICHDEDAEVYINGVLAGQFKGDARYTLIGISPAAIRAYRPGRNVLAVHCHQTWGGQYIDVGLIDLRRISEAP